ncbi:cytochrome P450 [Prauserella shujinwangii]|uniref:Cytochrome P450 n=1 Tax=Prauserella shujinwangii TaxID=1453103 RepID=A0A2T0LR25_9PSEU|nr:hypothetical protein [Prauserella shujinwangii]PRX45924.1 cytochrome P450 [Prauserella shujinwangii]
MPITVSEPGLVLAALTDPRCTVPAVAVDPPPGGLAWLRAGVPRFATGARHHALRALAVAELARLSVPALERAAERAVAGPPDGDPAADPGDVPVVVLAGALGLPGVEPADVRTVARHYQPHTAQNPEADAAVGRLVAAAGGRTDDRTAVLIGLLVQACDATARLVAAAATVPGDPGTAVGHALATAPPVRLTRRHARDAVRLGGHALAAGAVAELDLAAAGLPFGAGEHACPGREHAVALATGVVTALRPLGPPRPPRLPRSGAVR